tara:strand:- start:969 stop:1514 length:546 start_codon:yes stop_codon:yes gene_type:complete
MVKVFNSDQDMGADEPEGKRKQRAASVTRARARPVAPVGARVEEVAALMRAMAYRRGSTDRELAAKWKVSLDVAQRITAEASRVVARELRDPDRLAVTIGTRLEAIMLDGEDRDAVNAASVAAKLHGLNAAERVEVSQTQPVVLTEDWAAFRLVLLEALRPFPEAHAAVVEAIRSYTAGRQ